MHLREQPVADGRVHRQAELMQQRRRRRRRRDRAGRQSARISPGAIGRLQQLQALHHAQRFRQRAAEILIGAERHKAPIRAPRRPSFVRLIAAVAAAVPLDFREQNLAQSRRHALAADRRPAPRQRAEMDKIEPVAFSET